MPKVIIHISEIQGLDKERSAILRGKISEMVEGILAQIHISEYPFSVEVIEKPLIRMI